MGFLRYILQIVIDELMGLIWILAIAGAVAAVVLLFGLLSP